MNLAIIGPGALGCLLAGRLFAAGEQVRLVDYRPERAGVLRTRGIGFTDLSGERRILAIPVVLPGEIEPAELSIMTVKAHQTAVAARDLPALMAGGGLALTLQNGLGNLEKMADAAGPARLLAGVTFVGATRPEDGEVIFAGRGETVIGAPAGSQVQPQELAAVAAVFDRAGLPCRVREDIEAALWEKLMVNVGINPLTAILRVQNGILPDLPEAWELAVAAAREALAVATAQGFDLAVDPEARLYQVCTATAANRSSMLQDILAGRATEIEALNAQVVQRGAPRGAPTPVNACLTRLIQALSAAGRRA
jgi:2-dehydropantoate 2-reductase